MPEYMSTIGVDYGTLVVSDMLKVDFFDTAGSDLFRTTREEFLALADAALLVYDVTNYASFDALHGWLTLLDRATCHSIVVCGNQGDKRDTTDPSRCVPAAQGRAWADQHQIPFFETSALTGESVHEAFSCLVNCNSLNQRNS